MLCNATMAEDVRAILTWVAYSLLRPNLLITSLKEKERSSFPAKLAVESDKKLIEKHQMRILQMQKQKTAKQIMENYREMADQK